MNDRASSPLDLSSLRLHDERGDFAVYMDAEASASVVIVARPAVPASRARQRLERLAAAHEQASDLNVAAVQELGCHEGRPYVAFHCPAVTDLGHVLANLERAKMRVPYDQCITLIEFLMTTFMRMTDQGHMMGALTPANVFISATGTLQLIGFGENVLAFDGDGMPLRLVDVCVAPDVAAGAAPSPGGDLYAFTLLCRRLIPNCALPPIAERVLQGALTPDDYELGQLFAWSSLAILASHPTHRPSWREAFEKEQRAWRLIGVAPEREAFFQIMQRYSRRAELELLVDDELTSVRVGSAPVVALGTRRALRRILGALIERHRARPGDALAIHDLVEAGWPGESLIPDAAANRVYVTLSALRKLGLETVIERCDGGWRLAPTTSVRVDTAALRAGPARDPPR